MASNTLPSTDFDEDELDVSAICEQFSACSVMSPFDLDPIASEQTRNPALVDGNSSEDTDSGSEQEGTGDNLDLSEW